MIPNFYSSIPGVTKAKASVTLAKDKYISLIERILLNIYSANRYWFYFYILLFMPYAVIFGLKIKERIDYGNLQTYHQQYSESRDQLKRINSEIQTLDKFIEGFEMLTTESVHYHLVEKHIFETKKPSIYFKDITISPERSHVILKTSSFLDGAIFQRDFKSYRGVYMPLYSTEYWKQDSDSFSDSSESEFELKINFELNKFDVAELSDYYEVLSNEQMLYKLSLVDRK